MIKINNEIIATAEQNIVITQASYDKLTTAEKNNPLKTYFISDSSIAAQNLVSSEPVAQPLSLDDDDFAAGVDDSDGTASDGTGTEYVVADENGNVVGPMEDQEVGSTDFVDTDLIGLNIADAIGNASLLASYGGDGTIIGAIADLYKKLGVEPDTSAIDSDDVQLTYSDYLGMIGDRTVLDQYNMPNVTAALMDLFDRIADAENKAEIARVNAEDAMKAQAEAEAAQAAAEKAKKEAEEAKAETEKDLANATNRAENAEASASDAWKQLHDTKEELNAEKSKNELLQSELDAANKKSEETDTETTEPGESTGTTGSGETTDTDNGNTTPSESTDETNTDSSEDKSTSEGSEPTDTVTDETNSSTETGETTDTDKGDMTPPESTDETDTSSSEDKSTSEGESTDTVIGKPDASTETTENGESTETSGTTDQSSETTESPEETTTENKSEETVETPSTESTEESGVAEETSSETTTPTTEDSAPASSDEEK